MLAYASSGELVDADERVRRCRALRDAGVLAVKLRLHSHDWRVDLPVIEAVRDAVPELDVMVDANQGWRMPGDLTPRWDVATARAFATELERLGVYWLEEPLHTADVDGYASLSGGGLRIAAGEMVRSTAEARELVARGGVDVVQPDVVLTGGIEGARAIASVAAGHGRVWSPHTLVERLRTAREPPCGARVLHVPLYRGAVRSTRLVGRAARLAPSRDARDRPRRDDRPARRPGSRRRPRLGRARALPRRLRPTGRARAA